MTRGTGEVWKGPGSREGMARPTPLCKAIGIRVLSVTQRQVTPDVAGALGTAIYTHDAAEDTLVLTSIEAGCVACKGIAACELDGAGRIVGVTSLPGLPSFADTCRTTAGKAILDQFRPPAEELG